MTKRILAFFCTLLLLAGCELSLTTTDEGGVSASSVSQAALTVHYIDVGQADSILLVSEGASMLIDGGNRADGEDVVEYLNDQGVTRLDYAVATHPHEDHIGGLPTVIQNVEIGSFLLPEKTATTNIYLSMLDALEETNTPTSVPSPGETFTLGSCTVQVLGPNQVYDDANNNSIVLRVTCGSTVFLFTGDMETKAETDLLATGMTLSADVLKVGHHGSSTSSSSAFLDAVSPTYAVISCETGNDYGHPHQETLDALEQRGITLYRTDTMGTVIAQSDGNEITFTTQSGVSADAPNSASTETATETSYIGNKKSLKVHSESCAALPAEQNRVYFDTLQDALDQGYTICGQCKAGQ